MSRRLTSFLLALFVVQFVVAQAPSGYYDSAKNQKGRDLKTALYKIINSHVTRSYDNLWEDYKQTDRRPDGKVWDMYSNTTNYTLGGSKQGANYKKEGDSYNREHSFPKSWFGGKVRPMYTDLFHLYPTDGYINNRRSSFPFGETDGEIYCSNNDWSKVGACTTPGYTGTVFEPNDEYKGDFARTYFYMATCYEDKIAGWKSPMLSHNSYTAYAPWALKMLLRWAKEDPVSKKEIDRNNAVYKIQKNRNPYIDYPGLEQLVWGDKTSVAFDPDNYDSNAGGGDVNPEPQPEDKEVAAPVFSIPSGTVMAGTQVSISCPTIGASVYYQVNGGNLQSNYGTATLTINESSVVVAFAMLGESMSDTVRASYTVEVVPEDKGNVYEKVYTTDELAVGGKYLIVCEEESTALSGITGYNKNVRGAAAVTIDAKTITTEVSAEGYPYALTLGKDVQGYTFYDEASGKYLSLTEDKNTLASVGSSSGLGAHWNIELFNGTTNISNAEYKGRSIRYNADSPRFSTYVNQQRTVSLYKAKTEVVPDTLTIAAPVFSIPSGMVRKGTPVTISCATSEAVIYYNVNGGTELSHLAPVTFEVNEDCVIEAYAQLNDKQSEKVTANYTVAEAPVVGTGAYVKVTSTADLTAGSRYLMVSEEKGKALGNAGGKYGKYRDAVDVDITAGVITTEVSAEGLPYALTLGGNESGYTFYDAANSTYLAVVDGKDNSLNSVQEPSAEESLWSIVFEEGNATVRNIKFDNRTIRYNFSSPRFSTYKSGQGAIVLYKEYVEPEVVTVAAPQFSVPSGEVKRGTKVAITCATEGATIYYNVNNGDWNSYVTSEGLTINDNAFVSAYAKKGDAVSDTTEVAYLIAEETVTVTAPQFSVLSGKVEKGTPVTLSCATANADIYYEINESGAWTEYTAGDNIVINENTRISAFARVKEAVSDTVSVVYTVEEVPVEGSVAFVKTSSAADLVPGQRYLIVCEEFETAMSEASGKDGDIRSVAYVTIAENNITTSVSSADCPYALTLGGTVGAYTLYDAVANQYLAFTGKSNRLPGLTDATTDAVKWNISYVDSNTEIRSVKDERRMILYNNDQPRFVAYTEESKQHPVSLYKEVVSTGIEYPMMVNGTVDVYTVDGRLLRSNVAKDKALLGLHRGIYVVGGVKVFVR